MNAEADIRYLRWLLRAVYPHLTNGTPQELLDYIERAMLQGAYDAQGWPAIGGHREH